MKHSPEVSIVATFYNQENFVAPALESVLSQTEENWECIAVDDGSTDASFEKALAISEKDERIRAYKKENGGPGDARNFGIKMLHPNSRFVVFLDGDDALEPEFCSTLKAYLEQHPKAVFVTCAQTVIDEHGKPLRIKKQSRYAPGIWGLPRRLKDSEIKTPFVTFFSCTGVAPSTMHRRSSINKLKGFDTQFFSKQDTDLFCRASLEGEAHFMADKALYRYRLAPQSLTLINKNTAHLRYPHFRPDTYQLLRDKWDSIHFDDPAKNQKVHEARRYYYSMHKPLRDFKVAAIAFKNLCTGPTKGKLWWFAFLIRSGISGLIRYKILHRPLPGEGPKAK